MKKVIAILPNGKQVLTTSQTSKKNNYWITYNAEVILADAGIDPESVDNLDIPKVGSLIKGIGGHVYKIAKLDPVYLCAECGKANSRNRIANLFYCHSDFNKLVITEPIRRIGPKPKRNSKCTCGSNKKYKHCCISKQQHTQAKHYFNSKYQRNENGKKTA